MGKKDKVIDKNKSVLEGISLGVAFLLVSGFLYLNPSFLFSEIVSYSTGTVLGFIGIMGVLVEIGKINNIYDEATKYIGVGLLTGIAGYILYYFVSNTIVNFIVLFLALLTIYSLLLGMLKVIEIILNQKSVKNSLIKLSVFVLNLLIFILTFLQLLEIVKVIK